MWDRRVAANLLATSSWRGFSTGLKVEWCNHPSADELSVRLIILSPRSEFLASRMVRENSTVDTAAINSRRLIDARPWRCGGICHLQAKPSDVNPPMPASEASDRQKVEGSENEMWSIRIPEKVELYDNCIIVT